MGEIRTQGTDRAGLPNIRQPNLKSRVYELLLNMIIDGKYRDNDMLPPERVLCEELGVSRTVIREAIKSLESRGVLRVIHGKGIKVVPATGDDIANAFVLYLRRQHREVAMKDLLELRFSIEPEIAVCAAQRAEQPALQALRDVLDAMEKAIRDEDHSVRADLEFHLKLAHMTQNVLFISILESLFIPLQRSLEDSFEVQDNARILEEHRRIFECVAARDAAGAKQAITEHLQHTEKVLRGRGRL